MKYCIGILALSLVLMFGDVSNAGCFNRNRQFFNHNGRFFNNNFVQRITVPVNTRIIEFVEIPNFQIREQRLVNGYGGYSSSLNQGYGQQFLNQGNHGYGQQFFNQGLNQGYGQQFFNQGHNRNIRQFRRFNNQRRFINNNRNNNNQRGNVGLNQQQNVLNLVRNLIGAVRNPANLLQNIGKGQGILMEKF